MKNYKRSAWLFLLILFFLTTNNTQAQKEVEATASVRATEINIRWAFKDYSTWQKALEHGVHVKRFVLLPNGNIGDSITLGDSLKPLSSEALKAKFGIENKNAGVAAQMLYGEMPKIEEGADFTTYMNQMQQLQQNQFSIMMLVASRDFQVASATALGFYDINVKPNTAYIYQISIAKEAIDSFYLYANTKLLSEADALPYISAKEHEQGVEIYWYPEEAPKFLGYFVERADQASNNFVRLNKAPYILIKNEIEAENALIHYDSLNQNYVPYKYRLVGLDDFGNEVVSTEIITAQGRDKTPTAAATEIKATGLSENAIRVTWIWDGADRDLQGFRVEKATGFDAPFYPIHEGQLSINTNSIVDEKPIRLGENYYRVIAIDTAGNEATSVFTYGMIRDEVPPTPPTVFSANVDSTGIVTISWSPSPEEDVLGYRIFSAYSADHEFITVSGEPVRDTTFLDSISLKTLTRYVYYQIVALDFNYNHSGPSKILAVKIPDKVNPAAPVFSSYLVSEKEVLLTWEPSVSDDAQNIILKRREMPAGSWNIIFEALNNAQPVYTDSNVKPNGLYEYQIIAKDSSGLYSENPSSLSLKVTPISKLPEIDNLIFSADTTKRTLTISWKYAPVPDVYYVIYRSDEPAATPISYDFVEGSLQFIDRGMVPGRAYKYQIKAVQRNGPESSVSKEFNFIFPQK